MTNRFKFRIWDIKKRTWANSVEYTLPIDENGVLFTDSNVGNSIFYPIDNFVVQQWTGFKYENGRDIFEGDIFNTIANRWEVFWSQKEGAFICRALFYSGGFKCVPLNLFLEQRVSLVYLGNICEHPELLKDPISNQ